MFSDRKTVGSNSQSRIIMLKKRSSKTATKHQRTAFTLMEVILALSLSFVILVAIGSAIYLHLNMLEQRQAETERAQLTRSIMQMVGDDLRSAVQYVEYDTSALEEFLGSMDPALLALMSGEELTEEDLAAQIPGAAGEETAEEEEETTEDVLASAFPPTRPGLYGTTNEISIDVSRMPRRDQMLFGFNSSVNKLSDVKTVRYFVGEKVMEQNNVANNAGQSNRNQSQVQTGLIRGEMDRALARYVQDFGGAADITQGQELIAPEVTQIQFRYYDGEAWQDEWDSEDLGKLPVAIEFTMVIDPNNNQNNQNQQQNTRQNRNNQQEVQPEIHQKVIYIPISEAPPASEEEATEETTEEQESTEEDR